jgi:hypothetical protein
MKFFQVSLNNTPAIILFGFSTDSRSVSIVPVLAHTPLLVPLCLGGVCTYTLMAQLRHL